MGKWGTAFDILRDVVYGQSVFLDLYEQTTLHFIYRRTQSFGKEWESIPLRHFLEGVWSAEYGCITPRIRISEKKLLESLKSLEAKTIIQTRKAVTKSTRYRISTQKEVDMHRVLNWWCDNQLQLVKAQIRQMEKSRYRLDDENLKMLEALKQHVQDAELQKKSHPTGSVRTALPVRLRVTPQMREHNIPITSKKPMKVTPRRKPTPPAFGKIAPAAISAESPPNGSKLAVRRTLREAQNEGLGKAKQRSLRILPLPKGASRE